MRWDDIDQQTCSVARALSVVGERWTMLILRDAFLGTRRFDQFQKNLGVTRHRLSERLTKLVDHGVLTKVPYQERPLRHEYRLTRKGLGLYPVFKRLYFDQALALDAAHQFTLSKSVVAAAGLSGSLPALKTRRPLIES